MKLTFIKKLNSQGFSHHLLIPVLAIMVVAGLGAYIVTKPKAATLGGAISIGTSQWTVNTDKTKKVNDPKINKKVISLNKIARATPNATTKAAKSYLSNKQGKRVETCIEGRLAAAGKKSQLNVLVSATQVVKDVSFSTQSYTKKCVTSVLQMNPAGGSFEDIELKYYGDTKLYVRNVTVRTY